SGDTPIPQVPDPKRNPAEATGPTPDGGAPLPPGVTKEVLAVAVLASDPTLTDAEVARRVKCSRTSVYRMSKYRAARDALEQGRHQRRRGYIVRDESGQTDVEAIDE